MSSIVSKRVVKVLALGLALWVVVFLYFGYQHYRDFAVEDSIHGSFYPVAIALDKYCDDHNEAPNNLEQLIPDYLSAIPTNNYASDIDYKTDVNDSKWLLKITSEATGELRHYVIQDNLDAPPAEPEGRVIKFYHFRWYVIEPD